MTKKHPGVYLGGKVYWIKYSRNGRPFRESSHSERESDAVRLLNLRRGAIAQGVRVTPKLGRVLIDEILEDVVNDYQMNERNSSEYLRFRLKKLLPFFGGRKAADMIGQGDLFDAARRLDLFTGTISGTVAHEHVQVAKLNY